MGREYVNKQDSRVIENLLNEGNVENTSLVERGKMMLRTDVEEDSRKNGNSQKVLQLSPTILG